MCVLCSRSWGPRKSTSAHAGTGTTNPSVAKRRKSSTDFHSDPLCFSQVSAHGLIRGHRSPRDSAFSSEGEGASCWCWITLVKLVQCCRVCSGKVNEAEAFEAV